LPVFITQGENATARRCGTADVIDQNIHAAETVEYFLDDFLASLGRAEVSLDEVDRRWRVGWCGACCGKNHRSCTSQAVDDSFAHPLGAPCD